MWIPARSLVPLAALLPATTISAVAQASRLVSGTLSSAADSAPLPDAIVRVLDFREPRTTTTSTTGSFRLRVPTGEVRLLLVRIGFAPETVLVAADQSEIARQMRPVAVELEPLTVSSEAAYSAASSETVRQFDINLRPRETSQELLRLVPGLVIAQHAGGGKAEQIFLRGFDADHGTDVAVSVDGTPVNMVSHAHGQGYADLHFLMPEVVELGEVRKGPYDAQDGDFATAGAVNFRTKDRIDRAALDVRGGSFDTRHGVALVPFGGDVSRAGGYLAGSLHYTDGPFVNPQDYDRFNGFGKFTAPVGSAAQLVTSISAFSSKWNASGEIPSRAVASGLIYRFGSLDPTEGGNTWRYELSAGLRSTTGGDRSWEVRTFATRYHFRLWSDFTFFLIDSIHGDEIEQVDQRTVTGLNASYSLPTGVADGQTTVGAGGRADWTEVQLNHVEQRALLNPVTHARVREQHGYTWIKQDLRLAQKVRLQLGLRGDVLRFKVTDLLGPGVATNTLNASGGSTAGLVSPKANLAVQVSPSTTLFANAGFGFHSNDARDVILASKGETILPRALGAEIGGRHVWRGGSLALALWGIDLQSELVWSGDEGTTEASGRTRRVGVDLEARVRLSPWLWADADLNLARGRFRDEPAGADYIPLAPTFTSTGGLTVRDLGPVGGGVRFRHVGGRPADETDAVHAKGYSVVEAFANWRIARFQVVFVVDNLFNVDWNEAQFATTSRLPGEPNGGITELNFTPGAPRSVQVGLGHTF
jgi:hypothetical protein